MTKSQPPRLATWLLRRFVSGARNEPLLGDLVEEYRAGRSRIWLWGQVLVTIVWSFTRELREHRGLALRGAITTLVLHHFLGRYIENPAFMELFRRFHSVWLWLIPITFVFMLVIHALAGLTIGMVVARLHRPHAAAVVVFSALALPLMDIPFIMASPLLNARTFLPLLSVWAAYMTLTVMAILSGGLLRRPALEP